MTTFSNKHNAWAETDTWSSRLHPPESGQKEEGSQQGKGVSALPSTESSIFFQRTPEGHLGSIQVLVQVRAWDKRRPVTAPGVGKVVSTLITRGLESGYLQGRSGLPMKTQSNLAFLPNISYILLFISSLSLTAFPAKVSLV